MHWIASERCPRFRCVPGEMSRGSRRRAESFGGGSICGPPIDWKVLLTADVLEKLLSRGVTTTDLDLINEEFEAFWNVALGKMAGIETIDADTGLTESQDLSRAYFVAFDQVRLKRRKPGRSISFRNTTIPDGISRPSAMLPRRFETGSSFRAAMFPEIAFARL